MAASQMKKHIMNVRKSLAALLLFTAVATALFFLFREPPQDNLTPSVLEIPRGNIPEPAHNDTAD